MHADLIILNGFILFTATAGNLLLADVFLILTDVFRPARDPVRHQMGVPTDLRDRRLEAFEVCALPSRYVVVARLDTVGFQFIEKGDSVAGGGAHCGAVGMNDGLELVEGLFHGGELLELWKVYSEELGDVGREGSAGFIRRPAKPIFEVSDSLVRSEC